MTLDAAGDIVITTVSTISVFPRSTGTFFGVPVTQNTLTPFVSDPPFFSLSPTFDSAGDLFVSDLSTGSVSVLAQATGSFFGVPATKDTLTPIISGLALPEALAFDTEGNLYVANGFDGLDPITGNVSVLPQATGAVFGVPVTKDNLATIASEMFEPVGLAFDDAGNLFVSSAGDSTVSELQNSLSFSGKALANGTPGVSYSVVLTPSTGTPPYNFSLAPGSSLPPGLSLSTSGVISGVPTSAGTPTFVFTVEVTDSADNSNAATFSIHICGSRFRGC